MNFKNSWTSIEIASLDKKIYSYVTITYTNLYMTTWHVIKIYILTGHEAKCNLHFILKISFHYKFMEEPYIFSKLVQLIMEV